MKLTRDGYGQVEPNFLSAPRTGQVRAQLAAKSDIEILENGMFVKCDMANDECNFTGDGPWYMVFNEEKLYDEHYQMHKHYAMKKADFYDGKMVPRVLLPLLGDTYTTNMFADSVTEVALGDKFTPGADGKLAAGEGDLTLKAVKLYTMPDGQPGVKLQVIAAE